MGFYCLSIFIHKQQFKRCCRRYQDCWPQWVTIPRFRKYPMMVKKHGVCHVGRGREEKQMYVWLHNFWSICGKLTPSLTSIAKVSNGKMDWGRGTGRNRASKLTLLKSYWRVTDSRLSKPQRRKLNLQSQQHIIVLVLLIPLQGITPQ